MLEVPDGGVVEVADPFGLVAFGVPLMSVEEFGVVEGTVEGEVADGSTVVVPVPFIVVPPVAPTPLVPIDPAEPPTPLVPIDPLWPVVPFTPVEVDEFPFTVLVPVALLVPAAPVVPAVAAGF